MKCIFQASLRPPGEQVVFCSAEGCDTKALQASDSIPPPPARKPRDDIINSLSNILPSYLHCLCHTFARTACSQDAIRSRSGRIQYSSRHDKNSEQNRTQQTVSPTISAHLCIDFLFVRDANHKCFDYISIVLYASMLS